MSDLISRQAAISAICNACGKIDCDKMDKCEKLQLPPIQPEIIRCKDCQHSEYDALYGDRWCHYDGKAEVVKDDHYCGYAERRTDDGE